MTKLMRLFFIVIFLLPHIYLLSQKADTGYFAMKDSVLQEVTVNAFNSRLHWKNVPAAVALITSNEIRRYANTSLVPILNIVPGVRMEERSPASYRLSIRGSLLRSPFGVRNVKIYWNSIPITDAGGNTYLNLLDINQLSSAEIIKGPAGSMYGAGTGGVLLMRSDLEFSNKTKNNYSTGITTGSYGLFSIRAGWQYSTKDFVSSLQINHQQADSYREQSAMRRDAVKWQSVWQLTNQQFKFLIFYTDLFYQTPGGITLAKMTINPKSARQAAGALPGAIQQNTAIFNKTIFAGIHHSVNISKPFEIKSFVSFSNTNFKNPFITNYETRVEENMNAGTNLVFSKKTNTINFQWLNGIEWLYNHSAINNFGNRMGLQDTVQFKDNVFVNQWFAFSQMQFSLHERLHITAGLSLNNQSYKYKRLSDPTSATISRSVQSVVTPRVSILYKINHAISLYTLAAKGFSPPTLAEIRPSDGNFYDDLQAEYGWNYELGIKGEIFNYRLQFDIAAYFFSLQNAIVRRNNVAGSEYFVNAGETKQNGIEGLIKYQLIKKSNSFQSSVNVWSSYSYQPYRFVAYKQNNANYGGNELTGVPRNIWVSGIEVESNKGWYGNFSLNAVSAIPLTDANDVYADSYQLIQIKLGYRNAIRNKKTDIFIGIDNLLDQLYSLGNDINAAGKRYYNPASNRSLFGGVSFYF